MPKKLKTTEWDYADVILEEPKKIWSKDKKIDIWSTSCKL